MYSCMYTTCTLLSLKLYIIYSGQPDIVQVGHERFQCCECLFRPWLLGRDSEGIVDILHRTLLRCEANIQQV